MAKFKAKNVSLVAVSNDTVEDTRELLKKHPVDFPILSDPELTSVRAFAVEHVGKGIAKPATYVIGQDGTILYAYIGKNPTDRPPLDDVLAAVP